MEPTSLSQLKRKDRFQQKGFIADKWVEDAFDPISDYEEEDGGMPLLPPPIIRLSDRSQKRSSGRVTMPSSRPQGYQAILGNKIDGK